MSLKRIIPKGVNLLHKSVVRFKSTTSAESSSPSNEELNLKEVLKNIVSIVTSQSSKDVANLVVIWTGIAGAFFIAWEFFSIGQLKVEFAGMRQDIASQTEISRQERVSQAEISRQDRVFQAESTDKLYENLMNQPTDNQKQFAQHQQQFATLTGQFAFLAKENAEASKKADERYFELLNALKK